jgi:LysR family transcriptional regulator for metE and metH
MDLEIRPLRLVAAIAAHGTLTRAGDVLHLSQSALSHQLRDLEDRVGTLLFTRGKRALAITPAGETLLEAARSILKTLEGTSYALRSGDLSGPVPFRIATECNTCYDWLPAVLPVFRERFPHVEIRLELPASNHLLASLADDRLDLAVMSTPVRDRRVSATPLFDDELLVAVHPGHRLARLPYVPMAELREETVILHSAVEHSGIMRRVFAANGVYPKHTIAHVQLTEAVLGLVKANAGIAILAKWVLQRYLDAGTVRGIRLTPKGFQRRWQAVVPRQLAGKDYVQEFCRLLATHAPRAAKLEVASGRRPGKATLRVAAR